jgi:hypothetical protein
MYLKARHISYLVKAQKPSSLGEKSGVAWLVGHRIQIMAVLRVIKCEMPSVEGNAKHDFVSGCPKVKPIIYGIVLF